MDDDLLILHDASMQILAKTGMRFGHPEALELFSSHGAEVTGELVRFSEETLMDWVGKAPASFKVYARNPLHDLTIGGDATELAPGYGAAKIMMPGGRLRPATLSDFSILAAIYQQSPNFRINGGILAQPCDLSPAVCRAVMLFTLLASSDKVILGVGGGVQDAEQCRPMMEMLFGRPEEIAEKPRSIHLLNTMSPLQMDHDTLAVLLYHARSRQPMIFSPAPIAGCTGPMNLAGNAALANAEALAAIALSQIASPGTPVVYGALSGEADMRTGNPAVGSPVYALGFHLMARLAKAYGLPCRSGGAQTSAADLTPQCGYEAMMNLMATYAAGVNIALHAGGIMGAYAGISFEKLIMDLEIIEMVQRYQAGMVISPEDLALAAIDEVGPGGSFLPHRHTFENFRKVIWQPGSAQLLQAGCHRDYGSRIAAVLARTMREHTPGYLPEDQHNEMRRYLAELGWHGDNPAAAGSSAEG